MGEIGRGTVLGVLLALSGLGTLLVSSIPVTSVEEVINTSFIVPPGTVLGRYDNPGPMYHTRIGMKMLSRSVLTGELLVEEEGIYFTVVGYNTKGLTDLYVDGRYSFTISPADDLYAFIFNNTHGGTQSLVRFTLRETWTRPLAFGPPPFILLGLVGLLLLPIGLIILTLASLRTRAPKLETAPLKSW